MRSAKHSQSDPMRARRSLISGSDWGSRLSRLMCGGGSAPPERFRFNRGCAPKLGRSPKRPMKGSSGRSQAFRTSGGVAGEPISSASPPRPVKLIILLAALFVSGWTVAVPAHPLGNFTINHFARIEVGNEQIKVRYVIDMAEIPTLQELQTITGKSDGSPPVAELKSYAERVAASYAGGLLVVLDGVRRPLQVVAGRARLIPGAGGLQTMRIECDFLVRAESTLAVRHLRFEDNNYRERIGWRELVVSPLPGTSVFNSSVYGNGVSDELKSYPRDLLSAPLDEGSAELSFTGGTIPAGVHPLLTRNGRPAAVASRDRLAELIAVPELTGGVALLGLLIAVLLGGLHAMSPGHGKTIAGAYLIGSRGTVRHAAFLGLTVTITHTAGVFALGTATLLASEYVVPERLFPILSLVSGAIVVGLGLSLLIRRLYVALGWPSHGHTHAHDSRAHSHDHVIDPTMPHSHGGRMHSHLPPGGDGTPITWRSLLALGISGGILPCPSALVVLLGAISLHRVGYGLLLVVAFSVGLASVLTAVGLAFVYAGRLVKSTGRFGRLDHLARVLPVLSALVITCAGAAICYGALDQAGLNPSTLLGQLAVRWSTMALSGGPSAISVGALGVLGLGLLYGLKHATEVDHIVAVSTIVSEHRKLSRAAIVGGLWGAGHTASLVIVGAGVLALRVAIPLRVAGWLEFGVALMIIGLGVAAFRRALRNRADFHVHRHAHGNLAHAHVHFHEHGSRHNGLPESHSHTVTRVGIKPLIVGAMHGLAGSGALTLLVLTQINSSLLGLLYLSVFGMGSIIGMLLMSGLMGLPFVLSSRRLTGIHYSLQMAAGVLSVAFGIWYAYETGIASGLMKSLAAV
jgi:ABC-type nickel/cobalt efflux system permease component RcnA